jgi:hypothetical protein
VPVLINGQSSCERNILRINLYEFWRNSAADGQQNELGETKQEGYNLPRAWTRKKSNEKSHSDSEEIAKCSTYANSTRTHISVHSKFAGGPDLTSQISIVNNVFHL